MDYNTDEYIKYLEDELEKQKRNNLFLSDIVRRMRPQVNKSRKIAATIYWEYKKHKIQNKKTDLFEAFLIARNLSKQKV